MSWLRFSLSLCGESGFVNNSRDRGEIGCGFPEKGIVDLFESVIQELIVCVCVDYRMLLPFVRSFLCRSINIMFIIHLVCIYTRGSITRYSIVARAHPINKSISRLYTTIYFIYYHKSMASITKPRYPSLLLSIFTHSRYYNNLIPLRHYLHRRILSTISEKRKEKLSPAPKIQNQTKNRNHHIEPWQRL